MAVEDASSIAELRRELAEARAELAEARDQQAATSEILRVIASSPTDLQAVLNTIAESAAGLCDADDAGLQRIDGNMTHWVAHCGAIPFTWTTAPITPGQPSGRAILERRTVHIHDLASEVGWNYPESREIHRRTGTGDVECLTPPAS